ncbi:MAG TPA: hypothetical protein VG817_03115 [Gemmatimonadales bacterium]|nr:hypothetical protein [Gemmatimonadales bacterium]
MMRYLIAGVLLLAACSADTFKSKQQRALDSAAAAEPAPRDTGTTAAGPSFYVDSTVTWPRLQAIVRENPDGILAVQQTRALRVSVAMRNGMRFQAKEPRVDAIIALLRDVDPAGRILISNE